MELILSVDLTGGAVGSIEGKLVKKVMQWEEEDQVNEKRSQMGRRWTSYGC